jgi:hypothetical protein
MVSDEISQLNLKVTKEGGKKLEEIFGTEKKAEEKAEKRGFEKKK